MWFRSILENQSKIRFDPSDLSDFTKGHPIHSKYSFLCDF